MSVPYYSYWITPTLGPKDQINKFWEEYEKDSIVVNGEKCLYIMEVCDEETIYQITTKFPDVVFYGLRHTKIDTNIGWTNELYKNGEAAIIREEDGEDWRPAICDGLTIMYSGYKDDDPYYIINDMRKRGSEIS